MTPPDAPHHRPAANPSATRAALMGALLFTLALIGLGRATGTVQFHTETGRAPAAGVSPPTEPVRDDRRAVVTTAPPVRAVLPSTI